MYHECVQQPGELVYAPPMWWHNTENIEPAIAVGAQHLDLNNHWAPAPAYKQCSFSREMGVRWPTHTELTPNQVLLRAKAAWSVEPFNIRLILALGAALITGSCEDRTLPSPAYPPNGLSECISFLQERMQAVERQVKLGHLPRASAWQLVGRVGMWLERDVHG